MPVGDLGVVARLLLRLGPDASGLDPPPSRTSCSTFAAERRALPDDLTPFARRTMSHLG